MNKMIKGLLVTVLAVSAAQVVYADHTNKTFLMPRPTGVDLPMEYTTFESLIGRKTKEKFGSDIQATAFYKDSANSEELAKYFLVNHKNTIVLTQAAAVDNVISTVTDVDLRYLIHDPVPNAGMLIDATLALSPEIFSYGVRVDYHQDLDKLLKGLYFKVSMPVVCVSTEGKIDVNSDNTYPAGIDAGDVQDAIISYFDGTYWNSHEYDQVELTHGLIANRNSETGAADIDFALGYKFLNKPGYYAALAIGLTIPTGNEADGVYMFEPMVGNGQHVGLGADLDAQVRVWGDCDHNVKLNMFMKYRYLFESHENRTLQINGRPFSQYFLLGQVGSTYAVPAANVLTQKVDVTPGSQFDGIFGFAYNNGGIAFDFGYNVYFREKESVHYKGNFNETQYAIVAKNYAMNSDMVNGFTIAADKIDGHPAAPAALTVADLNLNAAATPSQFTNAAYAGLGYYFNEWETPLMLGLNGKYEFASENSAIEQWTVGFKLGIGF